MRSSSRKTAAGVARHELIGLEVEVRSAHAGWNGLSGKVVDETKHTFLVETASGSVGAQEAPAGRVRRSGRELLVPKSGQEFVFRVGEQRFVVRGDEIRFRPEDRTKKVRG